MDVPLTQPQMHGGGYYGRSAEPYSPSSAAVHHQNTEDEEAAPLREASDRQRRTTKQRSKEAKANTAGLGAYFYCFLALVLGAVVYACWRLLRVLSMGPWATCDFAAPASVYGTEFLPLNITLDMSTAGTYFQSSKIDVFEGSITSPEQRMSAEKIGYFIEIVSWDIFSTKYGYVEITPLGDYLRFFATKAWFAFWDPRHVLQRCDNAAPMYEIARASGISGWFDASVHEIQQRTTVESATTTVALTKRAASSGPQAINTWQVNIEDLTGKVVATATRWVDEGATGQYSRANWAVQNFEVDVSEGNSASPSDSTPARRLAAKHDSSSASPSPSSPTPSSTPKHQSTQADATEPSPTPAPTVALEGIKLTQSPTPPPTPIPSEQTKEQAKKLAHFMHGLGAMVDLTPSPSPRPTVTKTDSPTPSPPKTHTDAPTAPPTQVVQTIVNPLLSPLGSSTRDSALARVPLLTASAPTSRPQHVEEDSASSSTDAGPSKATSKHDGGGSGSGSGSGSSSSNGGSSMSKRSRSSSYDSSSSSTGSGNGSANRTGTEDISNSSEATRDSDARTSPSTSTSTSPSTSSTSRTSSSTSSASTSSNSSNNSSSNISRSSADASTRQTENGEKAKERAIAGQSSVKKNHTVGAEALKGSSESHASNQSSHWSVAGGNETFANATTTGQITSAGAHGFIMGASTSSAFPVGLATTTAPTEAPQTAHGQLPTMVVTYTALLYDLMVGQS